MSPTSPDFDPPQYNISWNVTDTQPLAQELEGYYGTYERSEKILNILKKASQVSQLCHPGRNTVRLNVCTDTEHKINHAVLHYIDNNEKVYTCNFTTTDEHSVQSKAEEIVARIQENNPPQKS